MRAWLQSPTPWCPGENTGRGRRICHERSSGPGNHWSKSRQTLRYVLRREHRGEHRHVPWPARPLQAAGDAGDPSKRLPGEKYRRREDQRERCREGTLHTWAGERHHDGRQTGMKGHASPLAGQLWHQSPGAANPRMPQAPLRPRGSGRPCPRLRWVQMWGISTRERGHRCVSPPARPLPGTGPENVLWDTARKESAGLPVPAGFPGGRPRSPRRVR